jgi:hypothetical protein
MKTFLTILILALCWTNSTMAQETAHKRTTAPFTDISLRVPANLYVVQGDEHSVEIKAAQRTIDKLMVEVTEGKLILRFSFEDRWFNNFTPGPIDIYVVTPTLYALSVQGSGNIYAQKPINTHTLELNIAGSGDIHLAGITCDKVDATITGSGDILFDEPSSGKQIKILIAGSGDVKANHFEAETAYIKIAGSGDSEVTVSQYLDVSIYGSGDVEYHGNPAIHTNIAGSGRISRK